MRRRKRGGWNNIQERTAKFYKQPSLKNVAKTIAVLIMKTLFSLLMSTQVKIVNRACVLRLRETGATRTALCRPLLCT